MKVEKAIEISDAKIQFVSLVDKAANKRQFLITKANDGQAQFSTVGKILKTDTDTHYVTGIVYEPLTEDAHGNYMTETEIRKAAYWFAKNGDKVDLQHSFEQASGLSVVENYVAPSDMEINGTPIIKGTWIMTAEVQNDDVWDKVQKGEITGFSMGGTGKYSEIDTNPRETVEKRGILKRLADFLGVEPVEKAEPNVEKDIDENVPVEKAGRKISGKNRDTLQSIYDNLGSLLIEFSNEDKKEETNMSKEEIQVLVDEAVKNALEKLEKPQPKKKSDRDEDENTEKIQKMVDEAVKKALTPTSEPMTAEAVQDMVEKAVNKAVEPILKARGLSSNLNDEQTIEKKNESRHYLAGIL